MSFVCSIPLIASLFSSCAGPAPLAVGYVEGEYVLLAPIEVASVETVSVRRGDRVKSGDAIAVLETSDATIAVAQAEAALAQAEAQLADLQVGRRPEEIAVLEATMVSAQAQKEEAERVLSRLADLLKRGISTQARFRPGQDRARRRIGDGRTSASQSRRRQTAGAAGDDQGRRKPGQAGEGRARSGAVAAVQAHHRGTRGRPHRRHHPQSGRPRRAVGAGPVDAARRRDQAHGSICRSKASLSVKVGSVLDVHCDGCKPGLTARVSYVSPDPEFTPPVIYSLETRQKLVFLIEARPEGEASPLQPGQIVDVALRQ